MYKRVLTCGTFDLFHMGHVNILRRAKEKCDYLIVGVSSDKCNREKNKSSVIGEKDRMDVVLSCKYVDEVFLEDSLNEKENYVKKFDADAFIIGDDWKGKFDYLSCDVIYLTRTQNISTTKIKNILMLDLWLFTAYSKYIHNPLDNMLMNFFDMYFDYVACDPNFITMLALLMVIPILYSNDTIFQGICFLIHDLLDRCDGSYARIYVKKNKYRDAEFGAYLDAICDKLFVFIIGIKLIHSQLLYMDMFIQTIMIIIRTYNYLFITVNKKNQSTVSGKMSTFMENMAFTCYFTMPSLYPFCMTLSIVLRIQSLYEKII